MPDANYNKIKHLVEVDDDILAIFTVNLGGQDLMENLAIAKNANITKEFVNQIFTKYQRNLRSNQEEIDNMMVV